MSQVCCTCVLQPELLLVKSRVKKQKGTLHNTHRCLIQPHSEMFRSQTPTHPEGPALSLGPPGLTLVSGQFKGEAQAGKREAVAQEHLCASGV